MLTETLLLRKLQRSLGSDIYGAFETEWYMDILNEETLLIFSTYYPYQIKGICMRESDGLQSLHPQTGQKAMYRYKIPKEDPNDTYIGIEWGYFPGNNQEGSTFTGLNPILTDAAYQKVRSYLPIAPIRYMAKFESPDICVVDPIPMMHNDFTIIVNRMRKLHEIPLNLVEYFKKLFVLDVKDAIYNEIKSARDSGVYNGIEVNTYISEYSSAASDRDTLIETFESDYITSPQRIATILEGGVM